MMNYGGFRKAGPYGDQRVFGRLPTPQPPSNKPQPDFGSGDTSRNEWADFLEGDPQGRQALFNASLPSWANRYQQSYLQDLYQPTYNQWLGNLGRRLITGQEPDPNETLRNFFAGKDWSRELLRQPGLNSTQGLFGRGGFQFR